MRLIILTLQICLALYPFDGNAQTTPGPPQPPIEKFPRQAPWCVTDRTEPDLKNFKTIFDNFNKNPTKFVPVSPNTEQSPTGFVRNISLSRIHISAENLPANHWYRTFHNYFHISIIAVDGSKGFEGLFVQPIGAPIGVPVGEFVTDFDCGDCSTRTSALEKITSIVPCQFVPAAAYVHPTVLSIGGTVDVNNPVKFQEAHFHYRYVDYPCYDVTFAQFLIIAVRRWAPPIQYEVFYSPVYKVNIEAVGAPYPMYYGWEPENVLCHHARFSYMENWRPQRNQRAKLKYSAEFDRCTYNENNDTMGGLGAGNVCKPGPVTCGTADLKNKVAPNSGGEWITFREKYSIQKDPKGTEYICLDCGEWEEVIGKPNWTQPPVTTIIDEINVEEVYITFAPIYFDFRGNDSCEERDRYAKNRNNSRFGQVYCQEGNFDDDLANKGANFGKTLLTAHSVFMVFTFTVGSNFLIYCARFLKEASFAEKGSGCFGVGKWLWEHIFFTYMCFTCIFFGTYIFAYNEPIDICKIYNDHEVTESCQLWDLPHRLVGSIAVFIFIMGYVSGWVRPKNKLLRSIVIWYHIVSGYLAKYIGLINLYTAPIFLDAGGIVFLVMTEVTFLAFYAAATFINWKMDQKMKFRVRERKWFPVPEGIDTFSEPPMKNWRALLFPCFIICQMLWFALLVLFELHGIKNTQELEDLL